jgi:hypothetical protein
MQDEWRKRKGTQNFAEKRTEVRKQPGRSKHTWEDITINFKEIEWETQDRGQRWAL